MSKVNNVTRWLDAHGIPYSVFELPAEKLGALETARLLGVDPAIVFKSIVVTREASSRQGSKGLLLVLVPGTSTVDLKVLAAALGEKRLNLPTEREAESLTGLQAGGISPLALINKGFEIIIDSAGRDHPEIHVSGGRRGLNIKLKVEDLARITRARFIPAARTDEA